MIHPSLTPIFIFFSLSCKVDVYNQCVIRKTVNKNKPFSSKKGRQKTNKSKISLRENEIESEREKANTKIYIYIYYCKRRERSEKKQNRKEKR